MSLGSRSLIWGCWLSDYWFLRGPAYLLCCLLFVFKLPFQVVLLGSFGQSLTRSSGLLHLKQFYSSFGTTQPHWQDKQDTQQTDLLSQPHFRFLHSSQLKTWPLPALLASHLSLLQFCCFQCSGWNRESTIALQLPEGKQILWCLRMSYVWSSSCGGLVE